MKRLREKKWLVPIYGLSLVILLVLGSVLVVAYPLVWEKIHKTTMKDKLKDIHYEDANKITGGLWTDEPYEEISTSLKFHRKMNKKEIHHYEDVRGLIKKTQIVVAVCAMVVLVGFALVGWRTVWNSGFASFILLGIIIGVWMFIDWHSLFKSLHWAIFWDDSWKLPKGSYSLGLFPHAVWKLAGGVIAGLVLVSLLLPMILRKKLVR